MVSSVGPLKLLYLFYTSSILTYIKHKVNQKKEYLHPLSFNIKKQSKLSYFWQLRC